MLSRCMALIVVTCMSAGAQTDAFSPPGAGRSNVPLTIQGKDWHVRIPANYEGDVELRYVFPPDRLSLQPSGEEVPFVAGDNGTVRFSVPPEKRTPPETVVVAHWELERWEENIQTMEKDFPNIPENPILFVGSSSIRGWKVADYFPDLPVVNHGFGGSEYFDALAYADRIIHPLRPRVVVLYDGDNDVARGKSPEWVAADMKAVVRTIHQANPQTPVVILSIKTSKARWELHEQMEQSNRLMAEFAESDPRVTFLDVNTPLLDAEGKPHDHYFLADHLHLSHEGYLVWTSLLRPVLDRLLAPAAPPE
ncbi:MAG TPA: GDSL-type esterase/lipase family protein [Candidatus Hydrogenedentes bacterium]|nr:GDSL-type esterase/lipase family protein [Candidatus Hydrogenedentota bacterium]HPK00149.1 GDSL-type esterase/lipase family protein [Candidatus Hydrogenedentota bacterium]